MKRILAIDQGTTATKTYTLDSEGHFAFCRSVDHRQIYPQPGWVEHDPEALLTNVKQSIAAANDIDAIGIDNQGETVVAWDGASGMPIYNAYFRQFLADVTRCEIVVPVTPDITAYGTGRLALIGSGVMKNLAELTPAPKPQKIIPPRSDLTHFKARFDDAVTRARNWR